MPKYNNEKSKYALTLLLYCNSCCHAHAVDFLQTHPKWVGGQETPYQGPLHVLLAVESRDQLRLARVL